ncbi:UTP--glucose-1-phosphate uridylyltransferase [Arsenicicoccus piscis]|nr:UTP--glucose-1-phosphate uridylyltransferase [Arsenicicoccus piscis]MCH8629077.1 UTP--glucose-1-phosphate uridylyltransferase [Arsenicicoccus piscis]
MSAQGLQQSVDKMRAAGQAEESINAFTHYYRLLEEGYQGTIAEDEIEPVEGLDALADLHFSDEQLKDAIAKTVVIKLNGGLGTSMGITGPKAALPVMEGLTFLDVIAKQVLAIREQYSVELPLVLMHSFRTRDESLQILAKYPDLAVDGLDLDFLQNAEPKLTADALEPVEWAANPDLEWCPPGHGDLFVAMQASGVLKAMRDKGLKYAFISNSDNLGAVPDARVAAWMAASGVPFGMEVCRRTRSDRKGGHIARRKADGRLVLRDTAMVVEGEEDQFQDISKHTLFNTNNLWIDLDALAEILDANGGVMGLPMIVNHKTVDPADKKSTKVIQIETGMGTGIEVFEGADAVVVERDRFKPVKTTNDLLVLRSDFYELDLAGRLVASRSGDEPFVDLDGDHYKVLAQFDERFPQGAPSLTACNSLKVIGDVTFGERVVCTGDVLIEAQTPTFVEDGAVLS